MAFGNFCTNCSGKMKQARDPVGHEVTGTADTTPREPRPRPRRAPPPLRETMERCHFLGQVPGPVRSSGLPLETLSWSSPLCRPRRIRRQREELFFRSCTKSEPRTPGPASQASPPSFRDEPCKDLAQSLSQGDLVTEGKSGYDLLALGQAEAGMHMCACTHTHTRAHSFTLTHSGPA